MLLASLLGGLQLGLSAVVLALFIAGLVTPYAVSSDHMTISVWKVCNIPQQASLRCSDAAAYFACPTQRHRVMTVRVFGIMTVAACAMGLVVPLVAQWCHAHLQQRTAATFIGVATLEGPTSTRRVDDLGATKLIGALSIQIFTSCVSAFGAIAMAVHMSLFTEVLCDGKPSAADTAGFSMGAGPKLMIAGFVFAFINSVCGICLSVSSAMETAFYLQNDEEYRA